MRLPIFAAGISVAAAETPVERGSYLVNAVMACDGCHTPRGPHGFDMSKRFSGGSQIWDEQAYTVRGSNITPDRDTGIGTWSADDLKRLMTEGMRPNGVPVAPQMPYGFYKILTPGDLDAIVAYVRTVEPVRHEVPPPVYKAAAPSGADPRRREVDRQRGAEPIRSSAASISRRWRTAWNAIRASPTACQDFINSWGKGGHEMKGTVRLGHRAQHLLAQGEGRRRLDR